MIILYILQAKCIAKLVNKLRIFTVFAFKGMGQTSEFTELVGQFYLSHRSGATEFGIGRYSNSMNGAI